MLCCHKQQKNSVLECVSYLGVRLENPGVRRYFYDFKQRILYL